MMLTLHIPDDIVKGVEDKLASQPTAILETIALDVVLRFLQTLREYDQSKETGTEQ